MIVARARRRLTLTYVGATAMLILILSGGTIAGLDRFLYGQEMVTVTSEAGQAAVEFSEINEPNFQASHSAYAAGTFYVVWSTGGAVLFNPANVDTRALRTAALSALDGHSSTQTLNLASGEAMVASQRLLEDNNLVGVIQVGHSLAPLQQVETEAVVVVLLVSVVVLLLSVAAGRWVAGRALVPVRDALDRQKRFTADASHELRSPLTVIDTGIQMLRRHPDETISDYGDVLGSMQDESRRMGRLVGSLLTLARADNDEAQLEISDVDPGELVRSAVRDLEPVAEAKGCTIAITRVDALTARLDADRFKQLIVILVDNAITHGPQGGKVEVSCAKHDRALQLEVADHGPGIPAEERERVFERFHRVSATRNGSSAGLGLSIARWIVTTHGGTVSLQDNHPGVRIVITLPLQPKGSPQTV